MFVCTFSLLDALPGISKLIPMPQKFWLIICKPPWYSKNTWYNIDYFLIPFHVGALAKYTGGQVYYYPSFQSATHGEKLRHELSRDLTRETAWEAVMRIRCGKGQPIHFVPLQFLSYTYCMLKYIPMYIGKSRHEHLLLFAFLTSRPQLLIS